MSYHLAFVSADKVIFVCIARDPYIPMKVGVKAVDPIKAEGSNSGMKHTWIQSLVPPL